MKKWQTTQGCFAILWARLPENPQILSIVLALILSFVSQVTRHIPMKGPPPPCILRPPSSIDPMLIIDPSLGCSPEISLLANRTHSYCEGHRSQVLLYFQCARKINHRVSPSARKTGTVSSFHSPLCGPLSHQWQYSRNLSEPPSAGGGLGVWSWGLGLWKYASGLLPVNSFSLVCAHVWRHESSAPCFCCLSCCHGSLQWWTLTFLEP